MSTPRLSKSLDDIRSMVFGHVEDVQDEYAAKGWLPVRLNLNKGVARGLIEIYCWGLYQLYQLLQAVFEQAAPKTATDEEWMEWHAEQVEASRKQHTKAKGKVRFGRAKSSGNLLIAAGRIVRTKPDGTGNVYRYVTSADTVIQDGQLEALVPVVSEDYGACANAAVGQICELVTPVPGVTYVTNDADWLEEEGSDLETIEALQRRYVLRWQAVNGMTKYAYKSWAMDVTGVIDAKILDQHPRGQGTIDVIIKGAAGIPTEALLEKVRASVATGAKADDVQAGPPVNDDWEVRGPQPIEIAIEGELELKPGTHKESAVAEAEKYLLALFTDPTRVKGVNPLQIGEDVPLDTLTATAKLERSVKKITWISPAQDVEVPRDGLAVLSSLVLTAKMASEE